MSRSISARSSNPKAESASTHTKSAFLQKLYRRAMIIRRSDCSPQTKPIAIAHAQMAILLALPPNPPISHSALTSHKIRPICETLHRFSRAACGPPRGLGSKRNLVIQKPRVCQGPGWPRTIRDACAPRRFGSQTCHADQRSAVSERLYHIVLEGSRSA